MKHTLTILALLLVLISCSLPAAAQELTPRQEELLEKFRKYETPNDVAAYGDSLVSAGFNFINADYEEYTLSYSIALKSTGRGDEAVTLFQKYVTVAPFDASCGIVSSCLFVDFNKNSDKDLGYEKILEFCNNVLSKTGNLPPSTKKFCTLNRVYCNKMLGKELVYNALRNALPPDYKLALDSLEHLGYKDYNVTIPVYGIDYFKKLQYERRSTKCANRLWSELGVYLADSEELEEAQKEYVEPTPRQKELLEKLKNSRTPNEAVAYGDTLVATGYDFVNEYFTEELAKYACLISMNGRVEEGIALLKKHIKDFGLTEKVEIALGFIYFEIKGDYPNAHKHLEKAADFLWGYEGGLFAALDAIIYAKEGKYERATSLYVKALEEFKYDDNFCEMQQICDSTLAMKYEQPERTKKFLTITQAYSNKMLGEMAKYNELRLNMSDDYKLALDSLIEMGFSDYAEPYFAEKRQREYDQFNEACDKIAYAESDKYKVFVGDSLVSLGYNLIDYVNRDSETVNEYAGSLCLVGRIDDAISLLHDYLEEHRDEAKVAGTLGVLYFINKNNAMAHKYLHYAMKRKATLADLYSYDASVYESEGRIDVASKFYLFSMDLFGKYNGYEEMIGVCISILSLPAERTAFETNLCTIALAYAYKQLGNEQEYNDQRSKMTTEQQSALDELCTMGYADYVAKYAPWEQTEK